MPDRIVGMIPLGQDSPIWWCMTDEGVHYVPQLDLHFTLGKDLGVPVPAG